MSAVPDIKPAIFDFGEDGALREELDNGGRIHIDRTLPFVIVNRYGVTPENSLSYRVATTSPAYVVWPGDNDDTAGIAATKAALDHSRKAYRKSIVISLYDLPAPGETAEDTPILPEFKASISSDGSPGGEAAANLLEEALCDVDIDLRHCQVDRKDTSDAAALFSKIVDGCECAHLSVGLPQVHFQPDGEQTYPLLFHDLIVGVFDALLHAAHRFTKEAKLDHPPHYRALGRRCFLDSATRVDAAINKICGQFDFLMGVSPINTDQAYSDFTECGCEKEPTFRYRPLTVDPDLAKRELYTIDFKPIEDPVLETLFSEKRHELDHQLTMLDSRNSPRFRYASLMLYETVDSSLLDAANDILAAPKKSAQGDTSPADCNEIADAARAMIERYREQSDEFEGTVEIRDDLSPGMMVSSGNLFIGSSTSVPRNRVEPLLHHEVGVHMLTYVNGDSHQLEIFKNGLADYEGIQEGLAVFGEWAVGGLTNARLRLLAARVVGVDAMIDGAEFVDVYRILRNDHDFSQRGAFNITARIYRSGGLAKDAIYLRGFKAVLDILKDGGDLTPFWYGKIAERHIPVIEELSARGLLKEPRLRPEFLDTESTNERIAAFRANPDFSTLT